MQRTTQLPVEEELEEELVSGDVGCAVLVGARVAFCVAPVDRDAAGCVGSLAGCEAPVSSGREACSNTASLIATSDARHTIPIRLKKCRRLIVLPAGAG